MKLKNKIALITGAGRGLGKETALELASAGAIVIATDARAEALEGITEKNIFTKVLNVRDADQAKQVIAEIVAEHGGIDILVNNAGVNVTASTEDLSIEEWDRIIETNLRGTYVLSHLVFPHMKKQGGGHIINIASSLAKRVKPNSPAYVASKWGVLGLSQIMFMDGRQHGIKVTAFSPAGMRTNLLLDRFPEMDQSKLLDPADVAKTIRAILELPEDVTVPDIFVVSTKEETWP